MTLRTAFALIALAQLVGVGFAQVAPPNVIGNWKIEINFSNGQQRLLRFEAQPSGKASFLALTSAPGWLNPAEPLTAAWTQPDKDSVKFSGPVQFPLGNVGLERGNLVLKGKFGADGAIGGQASFTRTDQESAADKELASKSGSFKATRLTD